MKEIESNNTSLKSKIIMVQCPYCSYNLVLLEHRGKYKCALCSRLFPQKEIEDKEFMEWNKRQRVLDTEVYNQKIEEELVQINELKKHLKYLFNGLPKSDKEYKKEYCQKNKEKILQYRQDYWKKNKEKILQYKYAYRRGNKEKYNQEVQRYRQKYKEKIQLHNRLARWREKQKELVVQMLKCDSFHSFRTIDCSFIRILVSF